MQRRVPGTGKNNERDVEVGAIGKGKPIRNKLENQVRKENEGLIERKNAFEKERKFVLSRQLIRGGGMGRSCSQNSEKEAKREKGDISNQKKRKTSRRGKSC